MSKLWKRNAARLFLVGLLSLMLLLAACGGNNQQAENNQGGEGTSDPAPGGENGNESDEQPFKGKTITFVVPFSPGGGYDSYARMIAPYLEKYSGATVVVQNISGGGGLVGTNTVYNSDPDDLMIGIIGGANLVFAQAAGIEGAQFEADKFSFLARVSADPAVVVASVKKPYESIEDLAAASDLRFAATGVGEDDFYTSAVIFKAFGVDDYRMVTGWEGSAQWLSAVGAGEIDGGIVSAGSAVAPVENGLARPILQVSPERDGRFADVPTALELISKDNENYNLVDAITNILVADRVLAGPPGFSEETTAALRDALDKALHDEEFLSQAEQAGRPVVYLSGEDLQEALNGAIESVGLLKPIFDEAASRAQ